MEKRICVFCASSQRIDPRYHAVAGELGAMLVQNNFTLVYGGGRLGLMGTLARSVHAHGGKVMSIIPRLFREKGWSYEKADRILETADMQQRKRIMQSKSHAFIALPGGLGTLDEILEIMTARQLGFHQKPLVLINILNFFTPLANLIASLARKHFIIQNETRLFRLAKGAGPALDYIIDDWGKNRIKSE